MIGGVVVESIVNISNRGSNIENRTENLKYVSSHSYCTQPCARLVTCDSGHHFTDVVESY